MCGSVCLLRSSAQETAFLSAIIKVLTFLERANRSFVCWLLWCVWGLFCNSPMEAWRPRRAVASHCTQNIKELEELNCSFCLSMVIWAVFFPSLARVMVTQSTQNWTVGLQQQQQHDCWISSRSNTDAKTGWGQHNLKKNKNGRTLLSAQLPASQIGCDHGMCPSSSVCLAQLVRVCNRGRIHMRIQSHQNKAPAFWSPCVDGCSQAITPARS